MLVTWIERDVVNATRSKQSPNVHSSRDVYRLMGLHSALVEICWYAKEFSGHRTLARIFLYIR